MSCLVTVSGRRRTRQERAWRFAREAGFELRLCAPRSPQTKGKDESANRFLVFRQVKIDKYVCRISTPSC